MGELAGLHKYMIAHLSCPTSPRFILLAPVPPPLPDCWQRAHKLGLGSYQQERPGIDKVASCLRPLCYASYASYARGPSNRQPCCLDDVHRSHYWVVQSHISSNDTHSHNLISNTMARSTYSRRSSASTSSHRSSRSIESETVHVPRIKALQAAIYLACGDPSRHLALRREVAQVQRPNGRVKTEERLLLVRDPLGYTHYFIEEDSGSQYGSGSSSGRRSSRSHRSSRGSTRAPSVMAGSGVAPMPHTPSQQHQPMPGGPGMPMYGMMGGGPMPGMEYQGGPMPGMDYMGGPAPVEILDGMGYDDDDASCWSGSGYGSDSEFFEQQQYMPSHMGMQMPPPGDMGMQMPPMRGPSPMMSAPTPMQPLGGVGPDGPGFFQIG